MIKDNKLEKEELDEVNGGNYGRQVDINFVGVNYVMHTELGNGSDTVGAGPQIMVTGEPIETKEIDQIKEINIPNIP